MVAAGTVPQDAALPIVFVGAAVVLGLGALLTLVPPTAVVGRPVVMVAVGGSAFAITRALATLTVLIAGTRQTAVMGIVTPRTWSAGPGLWCGVGSVLVAAAAAVLARLDDRRVAGDALDVADDEALADSRRRRGLLAAAMAVLAVVVLCLPTYQTLQGPSATLLGGFALDTWGVWALLGVTLGALLCATLDGRTAVAGAFPAAAAAIVALRLLVPESVRSGSDFRTAAGTMWTWVARGCAPRRCGCDGGPRPAGTPGCHPRAGPVRTGRPWCAAIDRRQCKAIDRRRRTAIDRR